MDIASYGQKTETYSFKSSRTWKQTRLSSSQLTNDRTVSALGSRLHRYEKKIEATDCDHFCPIRIDSTKASWSRHRYLSTVGTVVQEVWSSGEDVFQDCLERVALQPQKHFSCSLDWLSRYRAGADSRKLENCDLRRLQTEAEPVAHSSANKADLQSCRRALSA